MNIAFRVAVLSLEQWENPVARDANSSIVMCKRPAECCCWSAVEVPKPGLSMQLLQCGSGCLFSQQYDATKIDTTITV